MTHEPYIRGEARPTSESGDAYKAEDVRQGSIVLTRRWQRVPFFGALALLVVVALFALMFAVS